LLLISSRDFSRNCWSHRYEAVALRRSSFWAKCRSWCIGGKKHCN
jgi:hypothetical protein